MKIAIQYLEGGSQVAAISPAAARARLQAALERLPLDALMIGWDLPEALRLAVAEECRLQKVDLYLWQPLLTASSSFPPRSEWRCIGLDGTPVPGFGGLPEFSFHCPNNPAARAATLQHLESVLSSTNYQGVFLDRIRFPSPAADPAADMACFCPHCREAARQAGLDLVLIQGDLLDLTRTAEGRRDLVLGLLASRAAPASLQDFLALRQRTVSAFVQEAAELAGTRGLAVGLDCFSPTLAPMVGQDLAALGAAADWLKIMVYLHAFGPASVPYELMGLANWLAAENADSVDSVLSMLAEASGWELPTSLEELRAGLVSPSILAAEIERGKAGCSGALYAGIELVEIPGVAELDEFVLQNDLAAVRDAGPNGLVLSWELWNIPLQRLELVRAALNL